MNAVINGQADQDRQERDRQNVQMADGQRRKAQRVAQADDQAERRLDRPAGLLVAVDEDQRAEHQRHDGGHGGVLLRLRHFVQLQHRFPGQADVEARHLRLRFLHQLPQAHHRGAVQLLVGRLAGHQVNASLVEGDVNLLLRFFPRIEQRRDARRRRRARAAQAGRGLRDDAFQRRQRFDQGFVFGVGLLLGRAELRADHVEERHEVRRAGKLREERPEILQLLAQPGQVLVGNEQERLGAQHLEVALVEHVVEHLRLGLELGPQPLHKLAVLLGVLALDHHHQVILGRELLLEPQKVLVVVLVGAHQVAAAGVELQAFDGVKDAEREQHQLRIEEQAPMPEDHARQPRQASRHQTVFPEPLNLHSRARPSMAPVNCGLTRMNRSGVFQLDSGPGRGRVVGLFGVGIDLLHVVVVFQRVNQLVHRGHRLVVRPAAR